MRSRAEYNSRLNIGNRFAEAVGKRGEAGLIPIVGMPRVKFGINEITVQAFADQSRYYGANPQNRISALAGAHRERINSKLEGRYLLHRVLQYKRERREWVVLSNYSRFLK